jgi:hypothetical protein
MANYSDIKGFTVQTLSSDTVASQAQGGSWASGGSLSTARTSAQSSGTGNDNAILAGGYLATASPTSQSACESYNGTAWTEVNELNTARQFGQGLGTNTAAIIVGGPPSTSAVESWNGSSWTEVNEVNTGRILGAALGTTTAGLYAGGGPPPGGMSNVESWNGSSWTETSYDLNTGKYYMWGTGLNTNAIVSGTPTTTEEFNGSSWTETTESSTNHRSGAAGGVKTDALVWGGDSGPGYTGKTEVWNGSSWTELNDMTQPKAYTGGTENGPGSASALAYGGSTPTQVTATEEWSAPALFSKIIEGQLFFNSTANAFKETIKDIPGATWSSGGNLNTGRRWGGQGVLGIQTATLLCGGATPPGAQANTEQYNGTSWTEVNDLNAANNASMCWGTTTSAINCGGAPPRKQVESWDGTSWTETTDFNNPRYGGLGAGSSNTSGIIFGGENPSPGGPHPGPYFSATEVWDGSSWTEVNEMNQARYGMLGGGAIYTAAIGAGGADPVPSYAALTEIWDGTSWTEVSDMNEKRMTGVGFGITTSLIATGSDPQGDSPTASTELWDGTSWSQLTATISTDNKSQMSSGGANASTGAIFGGRTPPANVQTSTEEWTADLTNKTITAS